MAEDHISSETDQSVDFLSQDIKNEDIDYFVNVKKTRPTFKQRFQAFRAKQKQKVASLTKGQKLLFLILAIVLVLVIIGLVVCYFLFWRPQPTEENPFDSLPVEDRVTSLNLQISSYLHEPDSSIDINDALSALQTTIDDAEVGSSSWISAIHLLVVAYHGLHDYDAAADYLNNQLYAYEDFSSFNYYNLLNYLSETYRKQGDAIQYAAIVDQIYFWLDSSDWSEQEITAEKAIYQQRLDQLEQANTEQDHVETE